MPRSKQQQAAKHTAILEAALMLFAGQGVDATPMPAIAAAAGVATGTIYTYFESKDALVNALYRQCKMELLEDLRRDFLLVATPRQQFGHLWGALVRYQRRAPRAFAFLEVHHQGPRLDQESRALAATLDAFIGGFIAAATARGIFKPLGAELASALVMGAFTGLVKQQDRGRLQVDELCLAQAEAALWDALKNQSSTTSGDEP